MSSNPLNKRGSLSLLMSLQRWSNNSISKSFPEDIPFLLIKKKKKPKMGIYKTCDFLTLLYHTSATSLHLGGLDVAKSFLLKGWGES